MKWILAGLSHCNFGIVCDHSIPKLIMGNTESNVGRGNKMNIVLVCMRSNVVVYRYQTEIDLNSIM